MTAISLSTLDTYIVTVKQLYYEISIYMRARHAVLYIFEYVLKWKQIRAISLAMVLTALGLSLTIADDLVYQVGVAALSAFIYVVPILILEIWPKILWPNNVRNANDVIVAQSVSLVVGPMAFWLANFLIAPIAVHLYLIPVAITASVICGYGGTAAAIRAPRLLGR